MSKGVIGIPIGSLSRYTEFFICLGQLQRPAGTIEEYCSGANIAKNLNNIIRVMLKGDYEWLWIIADDHVFKPDVLMNLLKHNVDAVGTLYTKRINPFPPTYHTGRDDNYSQQSYKAINGKSGLVELKNETIGNAGLLVKRCVFEKMSWPWFEYGKPKATMLEDLYFCDKVREEGFKLYIDLDTTMGHIANFAVWPVRDENNNYSSEIRTP